MFYNTRKCLISQHFTVALFFTVQNNGKTANGRDIVSKPFALSDHLQLGTRWHIYLEATICDAVAFPGNGIGLDLNSEYLFKTLRDIWAKFKQALEEKNPCKEDSYRTLTDIRSSVRLIQLPNYANFTSEFEYNLPIPSRVCGAISSVFVFPTGTTDRLFLYSWHIRTNAHFKINITVTEMSVLYLPLCTTMYMRISNVMPALSVGVFGVHCPNYPSRSYYSSGHDVRVDLFAQEQRRQLYMSARVNEVFGKFKFLYQVHDNDFSIGFNSHSSSFRVRNLQLGVVLESELREGQGIEKLRKFLYNNPLVSVKQKIQEKQVLGIGEFRHILVHILYIQAPLGDSISAMQGWFDCSDLHSLQFYDGPSIDILNTDQLQMLIMVWECNKTRNKSSYTPINASIGDLTIVTVSRNILYSFDELTFGLTWTLTAPSDDVFTVDNIDVDTEQTNKKVFNAEGRSSFLSVTVVRAAPMMSVRLRLEDLVYRGNALEQCLSGGLFFFSGGQYMGGICSNTTSRYLLNHYAQRGISLGNIIHIVLKQYSYISYILAKFNIFSDRCVGYFNLLPTKRFVFDKVYYIEGLYIRKSQVYYENNYYSYAIFQTFFNPDFSHTLHVSRHSRECVIIQIGLMDHLPKDVYIHLREKYMAMLHLNASKKSKYSRFSVVHSSNNDSSMFVNCRRFRIDLDTKLEHTELHPSLPSAMEETWHGEAYNMKVTIPNQCLSFYTTFTIQSEDAIAPSFCVNEIGGYLHDAIHPVLLPGICGNIMLSVVRRGSAGFPDVIIGFQKPLPEQSCCYFDVTARPKNGECSNFIKVRERFPQRKNSYSVWLWDLTKRNPRYPHEKTGEDTPALFALQVNCRSMMAFGSMVQSATQICMLIHIYLMHHPCNEVELQFYAHHFPQHQKQALKDYGGQRELCSSSTCYVTPSVMQNLTWYEADMDCKQMGGHLVSINSEQEWNLITSSHVTEGKIGYLVHTLQSPLYFIGLRAKVSKPVCS